MGILLILFIIEISRRIRRMASYVTSVLYCAEMSVFLSYGGGNQDLERRVNLPEVTQLERGRAGFKPGFRCLSPPSVVSLCQIELVASPCYELPWPLLGPGHTCGLLD
jgi:hypothetical protein